MRGHNSDRHATASSFDTTFTDQMCLVSWREPTARDRHRTFSWEQAEGADTSLASVGVAADAASTVDLARRALRGPDLVARAALRGQDPSQAWVHAAPMLEIASGAWQTELGH